MGYYSATLNAAEWNYNIYDLELLAIVKALQHWRPLLVGSPHKIKVFSDHINLKYWTLDGNLAFVANKMVTNL
jgi:RNase H-like domain found in reverse transcriptase